MSGRRKRGDGSRATVRDVARHAGVSTATVSRALNTPAAVGAEVRERVQTAVKALAFVPDQSARSLSSRHTRLIGVLAPTLQVSRWAACVGGVEARLAAAGYSVLLALTGGDARREEAAAAAMSGRAVEAIVAVAGAPAASAAACLRARGIPLAVLAAEDDAANHPTGEALVVRGAWREAGQVLGRYLAGCGHVRCAWVSGAGATPARAAAARAGVASAFAGLALPPPVDLAVGLGAPGDAGTGNLPPLAAAMAWAPPPTALICADDAIALAVLRQLAAAGSAVPRDVSVVGCGDAPEARHALPALTTLRLSYEAAGAALADGVLAVLRGQPRVTADVPVKLVVRVSTGPAP